MKRPQRFVRVDIGHGLMENWYTCKVVRSEQVGELFGEGTHERVLVEMPGGTREWADYFEEVK